MAEPEVTPKATSLITPALTKDVGFNEKIEAVDTALKGRAVAQREIKTKWAAVVKVLNKYDIKAPARRYDAVQAANLVQNIQLYKPLPEIDADLKTAARSGAYQIRQLMQQTATMTVLGKKFPGLRDYFVLVLETDSAMQAEREDDDERTAEARVALQSVVDGYVAAIEAYDETIESVANVKEYIGVMKDVAEISAIAQGIKQV